MRFGKSLATLAVVVAVSGLAPAVASADELADAVAATSLSPDQFLDAFDQAELDGLGPIGPAPAITGDGDLDARIRAIGEARGYQRRPSPDRPLVSIGPYQLQPEAAAAWQALTGSAAAAGHSLQLRSAYRSVGSQVSIFRSGLTGTSDAAINERLQTVAVPGYSKHHTGYAVDIWASGVGGFGIRNTAGYRWLSENNFANAKAHGWVPSYPDGSRPAGPVPEPWELVWVGPVNIVCADFDPTPETPFCDTIGSTFEDDIAWLLDQGITTGCRGDRYCTNSGITRGQAATMLWRLAGEPVATAPIEFADVPTGRFYTEAVRWLIDNELTTGTTPTTFEPDRPLTRAEFVTFLWRYAGRPAAEADTPPFTDVDPDGFEAGAVAWAAQVGVTTGTSPTEFSPDRGSTRGEAAAFIHRFDLLEPESEPEAESVS